MNKKNPCRTDRSNPSSESLRYRGWQKRLQTVTRLSTSQKTLMLFPFDSLTSNAILSLAKLIYYAE